MQRLSKTFTAVLVGIGLAVPLITFAAIVPIGGRVTTWLPCTNGGYHINVVGAGVGSGAFVWLPGSLTFLNGPAFPGASILGTADYPVVCMVGKIPYYGLRIFMHGTGLGI